MLKRNVAAGEHSKTSFSPATGSRQCPIRGCKELVSKMAARVGRDEQAAVHGSRGGEAAEHQVERQLGPQQLQHLPYPRFTADGQTPVDGTPDKYGSRP